MLDMWIIKQIYLHFFENTYFIFLVVLISQKFCDINLFTHFYQVLAFFSIVTEQVCGSKLKFLKCRYEATRMCLGRKA